MIYIQIKGLNEVRNRFDRLSTALPAAGRRGVYNFSRRLAKKLREAAPRGFTGNMQSPKHTYAKKINKDNYAIFMPYYTKWLESGTRPHPIPRARKTVGWANMHFKWYTARSGIRISPFQQMFNAIAEKGTKPHPFTQSVINAEVNRLRETVEKELNRTIRR